MLPNSLYSSALLTPFQEYVYTSRYARFLHDENRRETWPETVKRYFDFFTVHLKEQCDYTLTKELRDELETAVLHLEVMPSMRCMMTAGEALHRDNIAGYNCSYLTIDHPKSFAEMLFILMNGTGVGFSVENLFINKLPEIPENFYDTDTTIIVADSKLGWAKALYELVSLLYTGLTPKWDLSRLRPSGAILKTFGGRSSGPEPLNRLFKFIVAKFQEHKGERLTSLAAHDIACMIGECVVVGGVRRSALISLSDLSDERMRKAKSGKWWTLTPWRSISNNSAVYHEKQPSMDIFMREWNALYESKSGERGIFSRYAAKKVIERSNAFRSSIFGTDARLRDVDYDFGVNPCSEIQLRGSQFCNLTEIVIRPGDGLEKLAKKAYIASILGTFQSTLTNFRFLGKKWADNTEDERLLGVSLTGIFDNPLTAKGNKDLLEALRKEVIATNMFYSEKLGIPASTACTCVKPSGTVSSLVDSSAGIHTRHSEYILRSVRSDKKDPLAQLMMDQGFYHEDDKMRPNDNVVFFFPLKSPKNAVFRKDITAIEHLEVWKKYQLHWADHKPSITVSVKEHEWLEVGAWVHKNFEFISGISFLPYSDHVYEQAPYQEITEDQYKEWMTKQPEDVDFTLLRDYENSDQTTGSQELACTATPTGELGCSI